MSEPLKTVVAFEHLLTLYRQLPAARSERTFMQISGYPHYENVCSNILAFFFDPENEHGLGDLLLQAFFKAIGDEDAGDFLSADILREYPTQDGGRLDLVITTSGYVVGIENKIFHQLENNLLDYEATVRSLAQIKGLTPHCVVLGLSGLETDVSAAPSSFISLTYEALFHEVKIGLEEDEARGQNKYRMYLNDFIETIEHLEGKSMSHQAKAAFYEENHAEIEAFVSDYKRYKSGLGPRHIPHLHALVEDLSKGPYVKALWVYHHYDLVSDFTFQDAVYALDTFVTPGGWRMELWARTKRGTQHTLETLLRAIEATGHPVERPAKTRPVVGRFALNTPYEDIAEVLRRHHQVIHEQFELLVAPTKE